MISSLSTKQNDKNIKSFKTPDLQFSTTDLNSDFKSKCLKFDLRK